MKAVSVKKTVNGKASKKGTWIEVDLNELAPKVQRMLNDAVRETGLSAPELVKRCLQRSFEMKKAGKAVAK